MPRPKSFTAQQKSMVLDLHSKGISLTDISATCGLRYETVRNIVRSKKGEPEVLPTVFEEKGVRRTRNRTVKRESVLEVLEQMPPPEDLDQMDNSGRERFWTESWNVLLKAAVKDGDLKLIESLLNKFRAQMISPREKEIHIQPVEFCPVLPTVSLEKLAHDMTLGMVDLIKGQHLLEDDATQVFSAVVKYYPGVKAHD